MVLRGPAGRRRVEDHPNTADILGPATVGACRLRALNRHAVVDAAIRGGADVAATVRLDPKVETAIATIGDYAWTPIQYPDAVYGEQTQAWISRAEVAEILHRVHLAVAKVP